jgi:hypothetical protein
MFFKFPTMYLAGMEHIEAAVTRRAQATNVPFEEAFALMPRKELIEAAIEGMPWAAREAFINGRRVAAVREQRQTNSGPVMALRSEAMNTRNDTTLSPAEYTAAQRTFAQMAEPLTADQLDVCAKLGMTPEAYKLARDSELSAALPGCESSLDADEHAVCQALGMSEAAYAAEKKRLAGG